MRDVRGEAGKRSSLETYRYVALTAGISRVETRVKRFIRSSAGRAQLGQAVDERQRAPLRRDVSSWARSIDRCRQIEGAWDSLQARAVRMLAAVDDPLSSSLIEPPRPTAKKEKSVGKPKAKRRGSGSIWTIPSGLPGLGRRR